MTSAAALARALALIFSFSPATREKERKKEFPPGYNNKRFLTRQRRESAPFVCLVYVCNMCVCFFFPLAVTAELNGRAECQQTLDTAIPFFFLS
jgi:hypothetical protein